MIKVAKKEEVEPWFSESRLRYIRNAIDRLYPTLKHTVMYSNDNIIIQGIRDSLCSLLYAYLPVVKADLYGDYKHVLKINNETIATVSLDNYNKIDTVTFYTGVIKKALVKKYTFGYELHLPHIDKAINSVITNGSINNPDISVNTLAYHLNYFINCDLIEDLFMRSNFIQGVRGTEFFTTMDIVSYDMYKWIYMNFGLKLEETL